MITHEDWKTGVEVLRRSSRYLTGRELEILGSVDLNSDRTLAPRAVQEILQLHSDELATPRAIKAHMQILVKSQRPVAPSGGPVLHF